MRDEGQRPYLGITEHTTNGLTVHFSPTPMEHIWDKFMVYDGTLSAMEAREHVAGILTKPFLEQTLSGMGNENVDPKVCKVKLIQQGSANGVYLVSASGNDFIFILSRGTDRLNRATRSDFEALKDARNIMQQSGIVPFVPHVSAIGEHNGVTGFSSEFLKEHLELAVYPDLEFKSGGIQFAYFSMNTPSEKATRFNQKMLRLHKMKNPKDAAKYVRINETLKEEVVARLTVLFALTGKVPRAFSVSSGDFMADPQKPDYDLRLITIRGGWQQLPKDMLVPWLMTRQASFPPTPEIDLPTEFFPILDLNTKIIAAGLEKGTMQLRGEQYIP